MSGARRLAAGLLLLAGGLAGLVYLALLTMLLLAPAPGLEIFAVVCGALALFACLLGAGLLSLGSRPFIVTPGRGLLRFLLAVGLGALVMSAGRPLLTALALPFLHAAAALLPALIAVGLAVGRPKRRAENGAATVGPQAADGLPEPEAATESSADLVADHGGPLPEPVVTWRSVATGIAWGGCAATLLALVVESLLALGLLVLVLALMGDPAALGEMLENLRPASGTAPDPAQQLALMGQLLEQPLFVMAAFMLMGGLAPFTEELAKLLGPVLARRGEAPPRDTAADRRRAWRRGVSAGAGFGAFEAIFYSAMAFSPLPWVAAVAVRACTTAMHAAFGGVAALGWHLGAAEGRVRAGLGMMAAAVLGHGLWNSLALGAMIASMRMGGDGEGAPVGALGSGLAIGLILLFYGLVAMFAGLTRWVNKDAPPA